jgi:hypothetical protein
MGSVTSKIRRPIIPAKMGNNICHPIDGLLNDGLEQEMNQKQNQVDETKLVSPTSWASK